MCSCKVVVSADGFNVQLLPQQAATNACIAPARRTVGPSAASASVAWRCASSRQESSVSGPASRR